MQEGESLKTTSTGQVGHWYSDSMDYKHVLQRQMISKYSDVSCLPDSPSMCLSWLTTPCHATVWFSCFSFVFLTVQHAINSKQQNKIFLKAQDRNEFYVLNRIIEWFGSEDIKDLLVPRQGRFAPIWGCSKPHPPWSWTLPGWGHTQLLWATHSNVSSPSQ